MSEKQNTSEKNSLFRKVIFLLLKQIVAAIICLCIALGLKFSSNNVLNNCAKALHLAINHNPRWEETVKDAFFSIKDKPMENEVK